MTPSSTSNSSSSPPPLPSDSSPLLSTYVPGPVAKHAAEIEAKTSVAPIVTRISTNRFRLTIANDRVFCTVDYKFTGNHWIWANSKLFVDGERREIMSGVTEFARLFHDPESNGLRRLDPSEIPDLPIIELAPDDYTNQVIQRLEHRFLRIDPEAKLTLVGTPDHAVLEIKLTHGVIRWALGYKLKLLVFILDGYDWSTRTKAATVTEDVFTILANRYKVPIPPAAPTIPTLSGSTQAQSTSNAVRVRRQTVIRN